MKLINTLKESIQYKAQFDSEQRKIVEKFIDFVKSELKIKEDIDVILQNDKNGIKTTAVYNYGGNEPSTIKVYVKDRQLVDILRSIAHEMTHHMQFENGKLDKKPADVGGPIEDEANAKAGEFIKKFANQGNEIYPKGEEDTSENIKEDIKTFDIKFLDDDSEKKNFEDYFEDKRAQFLYKKFVGKIIEFNHDKLSGKVEILSIGPNNQYIGFASSSENFNFEDTKEVKILVNLSELKYENDTVPVKFYELISRYLPPEDEEESYRGSPVEYAILFGCDEVKKVSKALGLRFTKVEIN